MINGCSVYEGKWSEDLINGKGMLKHTSGSLYIGYWQNGLYNGYGWFVNNKGVEFEGLWKDGEPIDKKNKYWTMGVMYDADVPDLCSTWSKVVRF